MDRDVVMFLGAGFSADADLPVMSEFANTAKLERFDIARYVASDPPDRIMATEFERAARTYETFRQACVTSGVLSKKHSENLERVFCVADALRTGGHDLVDLGGEARRPDEVVADIEFWIWKVYHQLPFFNTRNRNPKPETYRRFFRLLADSGIGAKTRVITTNYDIVFEWMANEAGFRPWYPIQRSKRLDAGTGDKTFVELKPSGSNDLPIFKLHGSINFFLEEPASANVLIVPNISDGRERNGVRFPGDMPAISAFDSIADLRATRGGRALRPAFVPPTHSKVTTLGWQKEVWQGAFRAISEAQAIVFVGYSMPRTDGFMEAMFSAALLAREDAKPLVFVVARSDQTHRRFRKVYGRSTVVDTERVYLAEATEVMLPEAFEAISNLD